MFLIASSGRSGTFALCHGLNQYSDHQVLHEPAPRLLEEAYAKHEGLPYHTSALNSRLEYFREKSRENYGESFRAPNLLTDIHNVVRGIKYLILIRNPLEYIVSAHSKNVFRKNDIWDQTRIIPSFLKPEFHALPLAEKLAWHWVGINTYLLQFVETKTADTRVAITKDLGTQIDDITSFLGVKIRDQSGLKTFFASRPNAATSRDLPDGYSEQAILAITESTWSKALILKKRQIS